MYLRHVCLILAACTMGWSATAHAQSTGAVVKFPNEIEFKAPLSPGLTQTAVVYGDPTKPGVFVKRIKFASGIKVMPHWHPDEVRTAVVLSGTLYFGLGEQWDDSKLKAYPAGTFFSEPSKTPHYVWAKDGEVILQITASRANGHDTYSKTITIDGGPAIQSNRLLDHLGMSEFGPLSDLRRCPLSRRCQGLVIWNGSSPHYKRALGTPKEVIAAVLRGASPSQRKDARDRASSLRGSCACLLRQSPFCWVVVRSPLSP